MYINEKCSFEREVVIGIHLLIRGTGNNKMIVDSAEKFIYVPLLETIQQLMLNPRIADRLMHKPTPLRNGLYFDVMDGSYFALDMYLQTKENCLQLLMFQDAIEICNPLGSR